MVWYPTFSFFLAKDPRHLTPDSTFICMGTPSLSAVNEPIVTPSSIYFITCLLKIRVMLQYEGTIHCKRDIPQIDATQVKSSK